MCNRVEWGKRRTMSQFICRSTSFSFSSYIQPIRDLHSEARLYLCFGFCLFFSVNSISDSIAYPNFEWNTSTSYPNLIVSFMLKLLQNKNCRGFFEYFGRQYSNKIYFMHLKKNGSTTKKCYFIAFQTAGHSVFLTERQVKRAAFKCEPENCLTILVSTLLWIRTFQTRDTEIAKIILFSNHKDVNATFYAKNISEPLCRTLRSLLSFYCSQGEH